jgi:Flp pilus assembly protein TadB
MIPLGAFAVAIVAIVSGILGEAHKQRVKADQRMAMIAKGMSAQDIDTLLGKATEDDQPSARNPLRSLGNARRTAVVLIASGLGLSLFGVLLAWIVQEHDVLVVAAAGLIPLVIGVGFVVDYHLQKRELSRFGLEIGRES